MSVGDEAKKASSADGAKKRHPAHLKKEHKNRLGDVAVNQQHYRNFGASFRSTKAIESQLGIAMGAGSDSDDGM
jgi:hypothetical protein